jgi:hypothetical protein
VVRALGVEGGGTIDFNAGVKGTFSAPKRQVKLGRDAELEWAIIAERIRTKFDITITHVPFTALVE